VTIEPVNRLYPDASWWMKFDRATQHFIDLQSFTAVYCAGREHNVTKAVEGKRKPREWTYRAWFDEPDPTWAVYVGDFLFDMRAALDHMAVALNPPQMKNKLIYFPIYREDPWRFQKGTRRYVERDAVNRRTFSHSVKRMTETARAYLHECQPYVRARAQGEAAEHHTLAILKGLNDADKHRRLLVTNAGCNGAKASYTHPVTGERIVAAYAFPEGVIVRSGALLATLPFEVEMEFMGSLLVGFGRKPQPVHGENTWVLIGAMVEDHLLALEPEVRTPPEALAHPTPP
jgi:hypothetical protein